MKDSMSTEQKKFMDDEISRRMNEFTLQLSEHISQNIQSAVRIAVKETVNGKIDKLTKTFDDHLAIIQPMMTLIGPMLKQFEKYTIGKELAVATFKAVAWIGGLIITLAAAYFIIKNFLAVIVIHLIK